MDLIYKRVQELKKEKKLQEIKKVEKKATKKKEKKPSLLCYYLSRHTKVFLFWIYKRVQELKKEKNLKKTKKVEKKITKKKEKKQNLFSKIKNFLHDVKLEMKKVKWPTKKDMVKYTSATISFIILFGAFFVLTDLIIAGLKVLVA